MKTVYAALLVLGFAGFPQANEGKPNLNQAIDALINQINIIQINLVGGEKKKPEVLKDETCTGLTALQVRANFVDMTAAQVSEEGSFQRKVAANLVKQVEQTKSFCEPVTKENKDTKLYLQADVVSKLHQIGSLALSIKSEVFVKQVACSNLTQDSQSQNGKATFSMSRDVKGKYGVKVETYQNDESRSTEISSLKCEFRQDNPVEFNCAGTSKLVQKFVKSSTVEVFGQDESGKIVTDQLVEIEYFIEGPQGKGLPATKSKKVHFTPAQCEVSFE